MAQVVGQPRPRRTSVELRGLILDAAAELFAAHGYAATRTRDVAEAAGVTEATIYRHFESKAGLFEAVVVAPFIRFIDDYVDEAVARQPLAMTAEEMAQDFVTGFFALLREHRDALRTIMASSDGRADSPGAEVAARFASGMSRMIDLLAAQGQARGWVGVEPAVGWPAVLAMVFSMVLHAEWLYPPDRPRPAPEVEEREVAAMILHGLAHRARAED